MNNSMQRLNDAQAMSNASILAQQYHRQEQQQQQQQQQRPAMGSRPNSVTRNVSVVMQQQQPQMYQQPGQPLYANQPNQQHQPQTIYVSPAGPSLYAAPSPSNGNRQSAAPSPSNRLAPLAAPSPRYADNPNQRGSIAMVPMMNQPQYAQPQQSQQQQQQNGMNTARGSMMQIPQQQQQPMTARGSVMMQPQQQQQQYGQRGSVMQPQQQQYGQGQGAPQQQYAQPSQQIQQQQYSNSQQQAPTLNIVVDHDEYNESPLNQLSTPERADALEMMSVRPGSVAAPSPSSSDPLNPSSPTASPTAADGDGDESKSKFTELKFVTMTDNEWTGEDDRIRSLTTIDGENGSSDSIKNNDPTTQLSNRVIRWPMMIAINKHRFYNRTVALLILSYFGLITSGFINAQSTYTQLIFALVSIGICTLVGIVNLTAYDYKLFRSLWFNFEFLYLLANVGSTIIGSMWMHSAGNDQWPIRVCTNYILLILCMLSFGLDAASSLPVVESLSILIALAVNSVYNFVIDYLNAQAFYPPNYACVLSGTFVSLASGASTSQYENCISSRSLFFGGQMTILVFSMKYILTYVLSKCLSKPKPCSVIRLPMTLKFIPLTLAMRAAIAMMPNGSVHLEKKIRSEAEGASPISPSSMSPNGQVQPMMSSSSPSSPTNASVSPPLSPYSSAGFVADNVNPYATAASKPRATGCCSSLLLRPAIVDGFYLETSQPAPRIRLIHNDVMAYHDPRSEYHLCPIDDPDLADSYIFTPLINSYWLHWLSTSPLYIFTVVVDVLFSLIFAQFNTNTDYSTLFIVAIVLGSLFIIKVLVLFSALDRRLFIRLMTSFPWVYMIVNMMINIYIGLATIGKSKAPPLNNYVSYFIFFLGIFFVASIDAVPALGPRFKPAIVGLALLNSLRVYIIVYFTHITLYPSQLLGFVYLVDAHDLALTTFTTITVFLVRYFCALIRFPNRMMMLTAEVMPLKNTVRVNFTRRRELMSRRDSRTATEFAGMLVARAKLGKQERIGGGG